MAKGGVQQNLPADVTQLIDQLERHCLAPDGSLVSKSAFFDLQLVPLSIYNPPPPPFFQISRPIPRSIAFSATKLGS